MARQIPQLSDSPWAKLADSLPAILLRLKENQTAKEESDRNFQFTQKQAAEENSRADRDFQHGLTKEQQDRQDKLDEDRWKIYENLPDDQIENFVKANEPWARKNGLYESGIETTMDYEDGENAYQRYLRKELGYDEALAQAGDSPFANMIAGVRQTNLTAAETRLRITNSGSDLKGFNKYEAERLTTEMANIDTMLMNPRMYATQLGYKENKKGIQALTTDLLSQKQSKRTEFKNLWGGKTAPKDASAIIGGKLPDMSNILDKADTANNANVSIVAKLPLANKPQQEQYKMVRAALKNPNLTDREIARLISASGGQRIGKFFSGLNELGSEVGKKTPPPNVSYRSGSDAYRLK